MIQLLSLLLISLGLINDDHKPVNSLHPQTHGRPLNINPTFLLFLLIISMILFCLVVFMFMPSTTESNLMYYHMV